MKKIAWAIVALFFVWIGYHYFSKVEKLQVASPGIVLGKSDLARVTQEKFATHIPISGELVPFFQTTIIAKVSAEVQGVYVREGENIKKNAVLADLNIADLRQTLKDKKAALKSAKASYQFSLSSIARYKKLLDKSYYSQNDYDSALNQVRVWEATVKQAEASLKEAQLQLGYAHIVASLDGIVSERDIEPGMNVSMGETLFKIVNLDTLEWRAVVPADQITQVVTGQTAIFKVGGLDTKFSGKVSRINPSTVAGTRAYYAYIVVNNPEHVLKDGMFATGGITLQEKHSALVIPYEAVRKNNNGQAYVYKIDAKHKIQEQKITVGLTDTLANKAEVIKGLNLGDLVLASSAEVQEGAAAILPDNI